MNKKTLSASPAYFIICIWCIRVFDEVVQVKYSSSFWFMITNQKTIDCLSENFKCCRLWTHFPSSLKYVCVSNSIIIINSLSIVSFFFFLIFVFVLFSFFFKYLSAFTLFHNSPLIDFKYYSRPQPFVISSSLVPFKIKGQGYVV